MSIALKERFCSGRRLLASGGAANAEEFGDRFGVALKGMTFAAGQRVCGQIG